MKPLIIGDLIAKLPIIQGGMGIGISRSNLAGAVAKEGGIGIISTAQIGYDEPDFTKNPVGANLRAIKKHILKAKEIALGGIVGVNIMVATRFYDQYVNAAVEAGADIIISGAGLPIELPKLVQAAKTKIAPIISSFKSASVILKMWDKKHNTVPDLLVIEGPMAGGHLGFMKEQLDHIEGLDYDNEIKNIISLVKEYEIKSNKKIAVVSAGGISDREDIKHHIDLGVDGVQIASRFVATHECDASDEYKQTYIKARKENIEIVQSPVGMPGRAIKNKFLENVKNKIIPVNKCYQCLRQCDQSKIPYCITNALINAVKGDIENGLIFCGGKVDEIKKISTVNEVMAELIY